MPNPYDGVLRDRVVTAYESGRGSALEVAELFAVSHRTVQRWVARWRATGSPAAAPKRGGWQSPIDHEVLAAVIAEVPDSTCAELCWAYNRRVVRARRTTVTSLWRAMRRAGYVLKKNGRGRVKSTDQTSKSSGRRS